MKQQQQNSMQSYACILLHMKIGAESKHMDLQGTRALIMGLGVNGSGIESAGIAAQHGAIEHFTDLRFVELLAPSIFL